MKIVAKYSENSHTKVPMELEENDADRHSADSGNRSFGEESNIIIIKELERGSESSSDSDLEEVEESAGTKTEKRSASEIVSVQVHMQKLIRYLKVRIFHNSQK